MGAGHSHALYVHEHSPFHRAAPETKVVAVLGTVAMLAMTPRRAVWAFVIFALAAIGATLLSRVRFGFVVTRLVAVVPFLVFALFIPFVAGGETTELWGVRLSVEGLWASWNVLAKAGLGAWFAVLLTATTEVPDILRGLGKLRVPKLFTSIAMFMIRYLELIAEEFARVRVAMSARGYDPRLLSQARPLAASTGALFVRSYERGERVHSAMLARGFTGEIPETSSGAVSPAQWAVVTLTVALAASVSVIAMITT